MADKQIGFQIKIIGLPQEREELAKLEQALISFKKTKAELTAVYQASKKQEQEATNQLIILNKAVADGKVTEAQAVEARKALNKTLEDSKKVQADTVTQLAQLNKSTDDYKNRSKELLKIQDAAPGSLNRMRAELVKLKDDYGNAAEAEAKKLAPAILDLNNKILASEKAIGVHQRDVGNYASAWASVPGPIGKVATAVQGFKQSIENISGSISKSVTDISGFGKKTGDTTQILKEFGNVAGNETGKAATVVKGFANSTKSGMEAAGTATTGFTGTVKAAGKALLATPIGWIIAGVTALIAVFAGLFSIWKSTGEGAGKMKDLMAGLHGIIDVLRNRVISLMDAFGHLFKGEFKKAAEDFGGAVGATGESMKEAADKAAELSKQKRQLTKDIAMHVSEEANENKMIQEYLFLAKDKTKTDQERLTYLKEAMRLSEEKAKREVEFAKRDFNNAVAKAALEGKIDKQMLADWIAMDQEKQAEMLKGSEKLRDALNRLGGTEALQALEESYAKIINAQTNFYQENKRTTSQISTFEKELASDRDKRAKERIALREMEARGDVEKMKQVALEKYQAEIAMMEVSDTQKLILKKQYEEEVTKIEQDALKERITLLEEQAKGSVEAEKKVARMRYEAEIQAIGLSDTQKELLRRKYNDTISKLDQVLIDEFIVKEDEKKVILKENFDLYLKNLALNEQQKAAIVAKYNSDVEKINQVIEDKRKQQLQKNLADDVGIMGESNAVRLSLQQKYEADVKAVQAKKLDKSETEKEISILSDRLSIQLAKVNEYEKAVTEIDKKALAEKKETAKQTLDEQIKNIEAEKKAIIDSRKADGKDMNANELFELEKETQEKILQLRTDYVTKNAALDQEYYNKQKVDLTERYNTELELNKGNTKAQEDIKRQYAADIMQLNADAVNSANSALLQEVDATKKAEEEKKKAKGATIEWEKNQKAVDFANSLKIRELSGASEFEIRRDQLEQNYREEKAAVGKNEADITLIRQKHTLLKRQIDRDEGKFKLEQASLIAGNLAAAFGEQTAVGKAAAVAQATINTYLAASSAYTAMAAIPPAPLWGVIAAAAATAAGLMNVQKIVSVPIPGKSTANKSYNGYVEGGKVNEIVPVRKSEDDPTINIVGTETDKTDGGRITTGISIKTGTKDDKLIAVNDTETVITEEQMRKLGGPSAMAAAGVPGYTPVSIPKPQIILGSGIMSNTKYPMFAGGGSIGIPSPVAQNNFGMSELKAIVSALDAKSDAINTRIDRLQVIQDVNKLNLAQKELSVINTTQRI